MNTLFRALPSMDACLAALAQAYPQVYNAGPRPLIRHAVTAFIDTKREAIRNNTVTDPKELTLEVLLKPLAAQVLKKARPHFRRVLNATGVVLHTNMGRAVLAEEAMAAVNEACQGYSNLELNLETGERGSRYSHVEDLLCRLTGAEAALVVNNNAAAVFLTLDALCRGRQVVVARGQLVEIGGSFRIPDVMERSGAVLREVGCTNRVHLSDYEQAVNENTTALMRVHTSNYRVVGFHADVSVDELAALARQKGLLLIEDLGSGSFLDFSSCGLPGEPTVRSVVAAGAHVVTFSGDKVLGGPQAGIIVGTCEAVARIKANPLNRALRIDKMTLAALEATLRLYLDEDLARQRIPVLRMIFATPESLLARAQKLARMLKKSLNTYQKQRNSHVPAQALAHVALVAGTSRVGGGSFPENTLPTTLVRVTPLTCSPETLRQRLLEGDVPVMGRLEGGAFLIDPRTLDDKDFAHMIHRVITALCPEKNSSCLIVTMRHHKTQK